MRMPSCLAKLGVEAISGTKTPLHARIRCLSTAQPVLAAPEARGTPSSPYEAPHIITPSPRIQSPSGWQVRLLSYQAYHTLYVLVFPKLPLNITGTQLSGFP